MTITCEAGLVKDHTSLTHLKLSARKAASVDIIKDRAAVESRVDRPLHRVWAVTPR